MTYTQRTTPDGKHTDVTCDRCKTRRPFVRGDEVSIRHWKAVHTCERPDEVAA